MIAKIIVPPQGPLFTIEELRAQCQVVPIDVDSDGTPTHPDDDLLSSFLDAAVDAAEDFTGLTILPRTYEMALSQFPHMRPFGVYGGLYGGGLGWDGYGGYRRHHQHAIELTNTPLIEVLSFIVGEGSDAVAFEQDTDYLLDDYEQFARLLPITQWPTLTYSVNTIKIQFRAGYELDSDGNGVVPKAIRQAIMLMVGDWYKNREDSNDKQAYTIPNGAQALLRPKRVRLGAA